MSFFRRDYRDTHPELGKHALGCLLAFAVFCVLFGYFSKAKAAVVCDVELSAGVGVADNQFSQTSEDLSNKVDLAQKGALAGVGTGCDLVGPQSFGGLMARYSVMHLVGKLGNNDEGGAASLKSDGLFEVAGRVGYRFTTASSVYVLGGWSWANIDLNNTLADNAKKNANGPMLGAGLEHQIGKGPWSIRGEYTWHHFGSENIVGGPLDGTKLDPDLHVVRAALVFKFGEMPNPLDEPAKPAAKANKIKP